MKKAFSLVLALTTLLLCLVGCDSFKHEHTKSNWKYSETEHWRVPECDRANCVLEDKVYDFGNHLDENYDHKCDVCEYEIEHKHISGEWQYDDDSHWVSHITCTWGACDVDPGIFGHSDRDDDGKCDECAYALKSEWYKNNLIEDGNIVTVTVSSVPVGYEYSYTGDKAAAIVDYVKNLNLITAFEEDPNEYDGMSWRIFLEYDDGYSTYVLHFGNMFIRSELGSWFKMNYDEASYFEELLSELNSESPSNQENAAPSDFAIHFESWIDDGQRNILDTYEGYIQKDLISDGIAKKDYSPTYVELCQLYQFVIVLEHRTELDFSKSVTYDNYANEEISVEMNPLTCYYLKFTANGKTYEISGDATASGCTEQSAEALYFMDAVRRLCNFYENTEVYKSMPNANGVYE